MVLRRPRRAGLTAALVGVAVVGFVSLGGQARVGARQARDLQLYVSVVDAKGDPVTGLAAADFVVREDGVAREVLRVAPATERMTIAILVDDSQAATRAVADMRRGLQSFVTALSKGNEIALITFGDRPTILVDYTATLDQLTAGINRLFARPGAGAYLLEAIAEASRGLRERQPSRPVLVVVTSEGPEFSNDQYPQVLDRLRKSKAMLNAFILTDRAAADEQTDEIRNRNIVLADGPATTGGRREFLLAETAITPKLDQLARELKNQYRLVYARSESLIPPTRVEVSVRRAGLRARAATFAAER